MKVKVARTGRTVTLTAPQKMFADTRVTVEEGYAGAGAWGGDEEERDGFTGGGWEGLRLRGSGSGGVWGWGGRVG